MKFAHSHPALYQTLMTDMSPAEVHLPKPLGHDELWLKVVEILTPLTGMANVALAAVTLWSFVHGMLTLERANLGAASIVTSRRSNARVSHAIRVRNNPF